MARPPVQFTQQGPTLRPAASPVDIFYQPNQQIPGEAVDNQWLQVAKSLQNLSPSLNRFLKAQEKKRVGRVPDKAATAAKGFLQVDDERLKQEWDAARKVEEAKAVAADKLKPLYTDGVRQTPSKISERYTTFDVKKESVAWKQSRLLEAKGLLAMSKDEANDWIEDNLDQFPGVTPHYASRPDFLVALEGLLGGDWVKQAKTFKNADGDMDTYANSGFSQIDNFAAAPDLEAALTEFERDGLGAVDERSQSWQEGAIKAMAQVRQTLKATALSLRDKTKAAAAVDLERGAFVDIAMGGSNEAGHFFGQLDDPIPPGSTPTEAMVIEKKNADRIALRDAHDMELQGWFYRIMSSGRIGHEDPKKIAADAIAETAALLDTQDPDGYLSDQFLDRVRSWAVDPQDPTKGILGEAQFWGVELEEVADSLDRGRESRDRVKKKGSLTEADTQVWSMLMATEGSDTPAGKALGDALSEKENEAALEALRPQIMKALLGELGADAAEDHIDGTLQRMAARLATRKSRQSDQMSSAQSEAYNDLLGKSAAGQVTDAQLADELDGLDLPGKFENEIWQSQHSEDARLSRDADYTGTVNRLMAQAESVLPDEWMMGTREKRQRQRMLDKIREEFAGAWEDTAPTDRAGVFRGGKWSQDAIGELVASAGFRSLMENLKGVNAARLIAKLPTGQGLQPRMLEPLFIAEFPNQTEKLDANGSAVLDDDGKEPIMVDAAGASSQRMIAAGLAAREFSVYGDKLLTLTDREGEPIYGDYESIDIWGPEWTTHIVNGTVPDEATAVSIEKANFLPAAQNGIHGVRQRIARGLRAPASTAAGPSSAPVTSTLTRRQAYQDGLLWQDGKGLTQDSIPVQLPEDMRPFADLANNRRAAVTAIVSGDVLDETAVTYGEDLRALLTVPDGSEGAAYPGIPRARDTQAYEPNPHFPSRSQARIYALSASALGLEPYPQDRWYESAPRGIVKDELVDARDLLSPVATLYLREAYKSHTLTALELATGKTELGVPIKTLFPQGVPYMDMVIGGFSQTRWQAMKDEWNTTGAGPNAGGDVRGELAAIFYHLGIEDPNRILDGPSRTKGDGKSPVTVADEFIQTQDDLRSTTSDLLNGEFKDADGNLEYRLNGQQEMDWLDRPFHAIRRLTIGASDHSVSPHHLKTKNAFGVDTSGELATSMAPGDWDKFLMNPSLQKLNSNSRAHGLLQTTDWSQYR